MDWILECDPAVQDQWDAEIAAAEEAADAATEQKAAAENQEAADKIVVPDVPEQNYTHCAYDDVQANFIYSQITSLFCIGGMLGGASVPLVSALLGRKGGLLVNNVLVVIAAAFLGSAKSAGTYVLLMVGRFVIGVNAGINAGMAPMYLSEIAPVALRGAVS